MVPPLALLAAIPFVFDTGDVAVVIAHRVVTVYLLATIAMAMCEILELLWRRYDIRENRKKHPLRGVLNVGKGIVWIVCLIISISVIIDRSPAALLAGLGAFAAALLLIFKDSILGFVAGVQLSQNDMLRVGDWIIVPSTLANGIVTYVSLSVVKIRNWDNTTVMLPPYTLVSTSFQNWRSMTESGCRRIARSVVIDNMTIRQLNDGEAEKLARQFPLLTEFVGNSSPSDPKFDSSLAAINGTAETNIGLFRAYLCAYLINHPAISNSSRIMVRLMESTEQGTPLQLFCFTNTTNWNEFEAIQSQIFEHVVITAPAFGLTIYNASDGSDITIHQAHDA